MILTLTLTLTVSPHVGSRILCLETRPNKDERSDQLRQESQDHPDGDRPGCGIEICPAGAESDKAVEDADADEDEGEGDGCEELFALVSTMDLICYTHQRK